MIRTLAWKDYREQRAVWLTIAVAGCALLAVLREFLAPDYRGNPSRLDLLLGGVGGAVAFTYGVVSGAMLLAGEQESRTLPLLDYLEGERVRLWTTKVITGGILTLAQAAVLAAVVWQVQTQWQYPVLWFACTAVLGLAGLAWGLLGSALCKNVLAAVAAAAGLLLAAVVLVMLVVSIFSRRWDTLDLPLIIGTAIVTLAVLPASGWIFCSVDRRRHAHLAKGVRQRTFALPRLWPVLWLTIRQGGVVLLIMTAVAVILGSLVPSYPLFLWWLATLLLGVGCGIAVFAGEQASEAQRFLGDQRLPIVRLWVGKTVFWFLVAVALAGVTFLTAWLLMRERQPGLRYDFGTEVLARHLGLATLLTFGLCFGFALGQLFTLVARKPAVAVVLAGVVAIGLTFCWLPSLANGGVSTWQVLFVPAVLLLVIPLILWAWAGGRLYAWRPLLVLCGAGTLVIAWMTGTFWLRAVGIPDVGEPFDVRAFVASLPTWEQNQAGRLIPQAAMDLEQLMKEVDARFPPPAKTARPDQPEAEGMGNPPGNSSPYSEQFWSFYEKGWPKDQPSFDHWFGRLFEGKWVNQFREASRLPPGMLVDLRTANGIVPLDFLHPCRQASALFSARALHFQEQKRSGSALDDLDVVLGLSRQLQHKAIPICYFTGMSGQGVGLDGMERWLDKPRSQPELVRALDILNRHEAQLPAPADVVKAEYLLMQHDRDNPETILELFGARRRSAELMILTLPSKIPWEEERDTRLMRRWAKDALREIEVPLWDRPPVRLTRGLQMHANMPDDMPVYLFALNNPLDIEGMRQVIGRGLCHLRGLRLILALALYEIDHGAPAQKLADLQPKYLDSLPTDPYSGQGFRYRVSNGEKIESYTAEGARATIRISAGQGVVWSVGPDRIDDGGKRDGAHYGDGTGWTMNEDFVFLAPRWAGKERQKGAK